MGEMHIFSSVVEKYAYFPPIDLKYKKLQKKDDNFSPSVRNPPYEILLGEI